MLQPEQLKQRKHSNSLLTSMPREILGELILIEIDNMKMRENTWAYTQVNIFVISSFTRSRFRIRI